MTDHDPTGRSPDDDAFDGLDLPEIDEMSDDEGNRWLAINIEPVREQLLMKFAEHVEGVMARYPDLDTSDINQYILYAQELLRLMAPEQEAVELSPTDWVQVRGLDYYTYKSKQYPIPKGIILSGQFSDIALAPHFTYNRATDKMTKSLPLGVHIAIKELCYVTEDGEYEYIDTIPEGETVMLTLHGSGVLLSKLASLDEDYSEPTPIEDEGDEGYIDEETIAYVKGWSGHPEVDISGGYSLN